MGAFPRGIELVILVVIVAILFVVAAVSRSKRKDPLKKEETISRPILDERSSSSQEKFSYERAANKPVIERGFRITSSKVASEMCRNCGELTVAQGLFCIKCGSQIYKSGNGYIVFVRGIIIAEGVFR